MRRSPPKKAEILERAREIDVAAQIMGGLPGITPTEEELKETGVFEEARRDLMTVDADVISQQESYITSMASELGLAVMPEKERKQELKEMQKRRGFFRSARWQIRGLRHILKGKVQPAVSDDRRRPSKPKSAKPVTKKSLLQKIRRSEKTKGMAHIEKDLGLKTDFHGVVIDTKARKILGSLLRKGNIYTPRESYVKITEPQPKMRRVSLRKPLDIGAAIRGKPIVALKPEKRVPTAPEKVMLPKKRPKKRKKARVERAGKTMRALQKVDGVKVFSFPDHIWGVRNARKKKKK